MKKPPKKPQIRHPRIAETLLRKAGPMKDKRQKRAQNKEHRELANRIMELVERSEK